MLTAQNLKQYLVKRWAKGVAIAIVVLAVIVTLLPVVAGMVIKDWYLDQGVQSVEIDDVDLNLFTGTFALEGLKVRDNDQLVLSMTRTAVNISWLSLFSKNIHIEEIDVKEFLIRVDRPEGEPMKVAGISLTGGEGTEQEKEKSKDDNRPWGFGVSVTRIDNFSLNYKDDKIDTDFTLKKVNLHNALTWTPDNKALLALAGEINSRPVSVEAEFRPFAKSPTYQGKLKLEGIKLEDFAELAKPGVVNVSGEIHLDSTFDVTLIDGQHVEAKAEGEYELKSASIELADQLIEFSSFGVAGATEIKQSSAGDAERKTAVKFKGNSEAQALTVLDKVSGLKLAEITRTSVESIDVNELEHIGVGKVLLTGLALLSEKDAEKSENINRDGQKTQGAPALSRIGSANVSGIQLENFSNLAIADITLDQVTAFLSKNKEGKINVPDKLGGGKEEQKTEQEVKISEKGEVADAGDKGFLFKIGNVKVTGKSGLVFKDASVLPKFSTDVAITTLSISKIDSAGKDVESPFQLKAKIDKYSDFDIEGKLKLFSGDSDFSFKAVLKNYELPHLSSYTSQVLGYDLASGQGNLNVHAKKAKDKIDGEAILKLNNLTVKETNPEYMKKLNEQLSIPLDLALSLLRDKNDDIKLTIPVTGDLLKPDIGLGDIINTALGNALKGSTMAYLKLAFQPYGALISIVQAAGSVASSIKLDPVIFPAGTSQLRPEDSAYLEKIARLIGDRKGIRIRLCGIGTEQDKAELLRVAQLEQAKKVTEQKSQAQPAKEGQPAVPVISDDDMFELARSRAESVKDHLINAHKIDPARLFVCHPQINKEKDARPSVELLM